MAPENTEFIISINVGTGAGDDELDEQARQLSDELSELNEIQAELAPGNKLPKDAKGGPITIGAILVKLAEAGGITGLINVIGSWLSRDERRSVTLQIGENRLEVSGITKAEQTTLIQWFQTQTGLRLEP